MATEAKSLAQAFVLAQSKFTAVVKDRDNPFFKSNYATYKALVEMLRPICATCGLAYTQTYVKTAEGVEVMRTSIIHASGDKYESDVPIMWKDRSPQGNGSALTYARRYGLQAAFGVAVADDDDDDDGNRAQGLTRTANAAAARPQQATAAAAAKPAKPNAEPSATDICPCGKSKGKKFADIETPILHAILSTPPKDCPSVTDAHREVIKAELKKRGQADVTDI